MLLLVVFWSVYALHCFTVSDTLSVSSGGGGVQLRSSGSERSSTPYDDIQSSLSSSAPLGMYSQIRTNF